MKKIKISSTDFQNVVNSIGRDKISQIDKIQHRDSYEVYMDYYKAPRDCVEQICQDDLMAMVVDQIYLKENHPKLFNNLKKEQHFKEIREGLLKFCKKNTGGFFFVPPHSKWNFKELQISVRPEIGLTLGNKKYFVKAYFGMEPLTKTGAELICTLLGNGFPEIKTTDETYFAVLDVRKHKLFSYGVPTEEMQMLLNAEAELFIKIWTRIIAKAA